MTWMSCCLQGNEALERATDRLELNLEEEQTRSDDFANNCKSDDMTDSAVGNKSGMILVTRLS